LNSEEPQRVQSKRNDSVRDNHVSLAPPFA
jgi:hypothetical protein